MLGRLVGWAGVQVALLPSKTPDGLSPTLPLIKTPRPDQAKHSLSDNLEQ